MFERAQSAATEFRSSISINEMEQIITSVAQGQLEYPHFSPWMNSKLREILGVYIRAHQVERLGSLPFMNEIRHRMDRPPLSIEGLVGFKVTLEDFGVRPDSKIDIRSLTDEALDLFGSTEGHRLKLDYLNFEIENGVFIPLAFSPNLSKLERSGKSFKDAFPESFDLYDHNGQLDHPTIFWLYSTMIREKIVRAEVEQMINKGTLDWNIHLSQKVADQYILLASFYPELLPILGKMPALDIEPYIMLPYKDLHGTPFVQTSYPRLREAPNMLASLVFEKSISGNTVMIEGVRGFEIEISLVNPKDLDFNPIPEFLVKSTISNVTAAWGVFASRESLSRSAIELDAPVINAEHGHPGKDVISVTFREIEGTPISLDKIAEFYLEITSDNKRDYRGRRHVRE